MIKKLDRRLAVSAVACIVSILFATGCPPAKPPETGPKSGDKSDKPKESQGSEVKTVKLPRSMVIGKNVTLSGFYEDQPLPDSKSGDVGDRPNSGGSGDRPGVASAGSQTQNLYKIVAPATVIIRSERGYGTGVIYDPAGWILTNHHVVAHAKRDEFRWKVKVGLGKLSKKGVVEQRKGKFEAEVYKIAPLLDIAVLKLIKPPKDLISIRISDKDPVPGQHVTSIGHAGIGLLWAIKDGQIAAIGKLATHLAQLQLYQTLKDKMKNDKKPNFKAKMSAKRMKALVSYLEKKVPALVIQSTCDISQGDSGGPLVNNRAELVGLNAFVRGARRSRKESNFHVHVAEIRKFIKEVPKKAPQLLPNPWNDGGSLAKLGDADMDSTIDTLAMYKVRRYGFFTRKTPMAYFIDLDQNALMGKAETSVEKLVENKDFDAEVIFLSSGRYLHAWYDTSGDGKHDVLLVVDSKKRHLTRGYRINAEGTVRKDAGLDAGMLIRPELFSDPKMSARLASIGARLFNSRLIKIKKGGKQFYPAPLGSAGHDGKLKDYSRDGRPDTVRAEGLFSSGYIVDADQDSLGRHKVGATLHDVKKSGKIDAEFSWINMKRQHWAWYDTDNNGEFDLLLHGEQYPGNVVKEAWRVAGGKYTKEPAMVGRLMVQPELLDGDERAQMLRKVATRILMKSRVATGEGIKSFPDPDKYYRWGFKLKDVKKWKAVAATVRMYRCQGILVDVDRDTKRKAKKAKKSIPEMLKDHKFDAEFAQITCKGSVWTFYDSRGKGAFDTVLYSAKKGKGKPTAAYVIDKKGQLALRKKPIACDGLIHPALFKNRKLKRAFSKIAAALFSSAPDLKCRKP